MIRVKIDRQTHDRTIHSFSVTGHADFAESGKDIVCAGVSAITVGTVNAAEAVLGVSLQNTMDKGLLKVTVPDYLDAEKREKVQLLLESMIVMLESIKQSYGKYIEIKSN